MWWEKKRSARYWLRRLKHRSPDIRRKAVEKLGELGDTRAIVSLAYILSHDAVFVRWEAAEALGKIQDLRAVEPLIRALRDDDWTVRKNAAWALGQLGEPHAVAPLIQMLKDPDMDVRKASIRALAAIDDTRAVPPLLKMLRTRLFSVRLETVRALGKICDPRAIPSLQILLRDTSSLIRGEAQAGLRKTYTAVEIVMFGQYNQTRRLEGSTFPNPDASDFTFAMPSLKRIEIFAEAYDFHQVERFMTYAVNYVGQKHLKDHVDVYIYGYPNHLHPNLRNIFHNLCHRIHVYESS